MLGSILNQRDTTIILRNGLYNGLILVMQLCLLVITTQVGACYMNNQLLQKESIPGKDGFSVRMQLINTHLGVMG